MNIPKRWFVAGMIWACCLSGLMASDAVKSGQQVEIRTAMGVIVVDLDAVASPQSCAAFLSYIRQHVYDQSAFHQKDEADIQGGRPGPRTSQFSRSGNFFENAPPGEFKLKHVRGAIGLARTVGDCNPMKTSNSTQFYIMLKDEPKDDGNYSVFGHVVRGMDVVDKIAAALALDKTKPVKLDLRVL